jgi:lipoprotein-anchoring transpeptidase ErfK/SrfK
MRTKRAINLALALLLAGAGLFASFAVVATAPAQTADNTDTATTAPTTTTAAEIPKGVTIGGVPVGEMSIGMARVTVEDHFSARLLLQIGRKRITLDPSEIGARADIDDALSVAEWAQPGDDVPLDVTLNNWFLKKYVKALARRFDRPAVNARVYLRRSRPWITEGKRGQQLRKTPATRAIRAALIANRRFAVNLPVKVIPRHVTKRSVGPVIVIRRGSNRLYLYKGARFWRRFPVATGQSVYPTPLGRFEIVEKRENPWWIPPNSPWARGESPVPPGPGNPLGTRWMGLSAPGVGIHGSPNASSIGYSLSHGCIRMYIPDAEWLFVHVSVGTPVFIIPK